MPLCCLTKFPKEHPETFDVMGLSSPLRLLALHPLSETNSGGFSSGASSSNILRLCFSGTSINVVLKARYFSRNNTRIYQRKLPKNLRYPRRSKIPPEPYIPGLNRVPKKKVSSFFTTDTDEDDEDVNRLVVDDHDYENELQEEDEEDEEEGSNFKDDENGEIAWEADEIEAISSLFKGRIPQKPGKLSRQRPLPLPLPYKNRPLGLPTQKKFSRKPTFSAATTRQPVSDQLYKNPTFLIGLAREIRCLPPEENNVSLVLNKYIRFLRKGSLSMTVRELGHMGLPERALQVFCWVQNQPHFYPDDRILASTVEVLARSQDLKMLFKMDDDKLINLASRGVFEAMVRGFIKGGNLQIAWKLLLAAKDGKRVLDAGIYAKLILEIGKIPDKEILVLSLLEELAGREDLNLTLQDCTAIMKICVKLRQFETVEGLYDWFKKSGREPSIVMYTTVVHSRYTEQKYREALAVVWEMEASNCLFDLPAYRVAIKLFVAWNDLPRAVRYFSKLKDAGFSPTFDLYKDMIHIYMASGRIAKCKQICREAEMAGFKLDYQAES